MNSDQLPSELGGRVRVAREAARMSQATFAAKLGVARSSLAKWEGGQRTPDALVLADMCRVLRTAPTFLLNLDQDPFVEAINLRLALLIQAEGNQVAKTVLEIGEEALDCLLNGRLQIPSPKIEPLARAYRVSALWLLTGNPRFWTPDLESGVGTRLRFFRVANGVPPADSYSASLETSEEAMQEMLAAGWDIEATFSTVLALTRTYKPKGDWRCDLAWVLRGGPNFLGEE